MNPNFVGEKTLVVREGVSIKDIRPCGRNVKVLHKRKGTLVGVHRTNSAVGVGGGQTLD